MSSEDEYYDIWSGANLIDTIFMLLTIVLMFAFFFLRMIFPLTANEGIIWAFVIESYALGFVILRTRLREKHRKAVRSIKFCYAGIWRDFTYYERKLLGMKQWYKIEIDWTDEMLDELFKDNIFQSLQSEIENWQKLDSFHNPKSMPSNVYGEDEDEAKRIIEQVPFKSFNIGDITDETREELRKYNIYIGILYEPETYKDSEIAFDRICLLTETDITKSLECKPSTAMHNGYPVDIDQVECAFNQLGWILPEIPTYILAWSENITKKILEPSLEAQSIIYIQMKVLEKFVYTLRAFSQQAVMTIKQEQTKSDMYYDVWDDLIQEIENMNINAILGSKDIQRIKLEEEVKKGSKYKMLSYVLIGVIAIIVFIMMFISVAGNNTPIVVIDDGTNALSVVNYLINLIG